jgi:hypothetical protein
VVVHATRAPWLGPPNRLLGVGATALCVRWGSYLAVLMDINKPIDPRTKHPHISKIGNNEMMRINIEISANLEHLLHFLQSDEHECYRLLERAYAYLPMPQRWVKHDFQLAAVILAIAKFFNEHPERLNFDPAYTDRLLTHPFRVVANLITLWAYRNGEVENVHAGVTPRVIVIRSASARCSGRPRPTDSPGLGQVIRSASAN